MWMVFYWNWRENLSCRSSSIMWDHQLESVASMGCAWKWPINQRQWLYFNRGVWWLRHEQNVYTMYLLHIPGPDFFQICVPSVSCIHKNPTRSMSSSRTRFLVKLCDVCSHMLWLKLMFAAFSEEVDDSKIAWQHISTNIQLLADNQQSFEDNETETKLLWSCWTLHPWDFHKIYAAQILKTSQTDRVTLAPLEPWDLLKRGSNVQDWLVASKLGRLGFATWKS